MISWHSERLGTAAGYYLVERWMEDEQAQK